MVFGSEEQSTASEDQHAEETIQRQKTIPPGVRDPIYLWSSLIAGAGSGAFASIICAPLDLIRTRLQVLAEVTGTSQHSAIPRMIRDIVAKEGYTGCFRGLGAALVTVPAFWGVYCK